VRERGESLSLEVDGVVLEEETSALLQLEVEEEAEEGREGGREGGREEVCDLGGEREGGYVPGGREGGRKGGRARRTAESVLQRKDSSPRVKATPPHPLPPSLPPPRPPPPSLVPLQGRTRRRKRGRHFSSLPPSLPPSGC